MVESEQCPAIADLSELMDGRLVEPQLSSFATHLENCGYCQAKVKTLAPSDTLQEHLRGDAPEVDRIADATPRNLIDRLKQIPYVDSNGRLAMALLSGDLALQHDEQEFPFASSSETPSDNIGQLGQYHILRTLGKGGMGVVFQARDTKLGRDVALKVMRPRIASISAAKERFLHEAQSAAKLNNDHIVTIYEVGECDRVPYLAMELLEGQTLEDYLRFNTTLNIQQVLSFGRDIAIGLREAHAKGLIHRDIKPSNLWVEETPSGTERVKILDFGLARADIDDIQMTHTGAIVGTPAFMAPEQARGDKKVDARADLFSLGCVLYLMATQELPFKSETTMGTLMALALSHPMSPSELQAAVPKPLSGLILQLLQKDAALRPSSAQDVIDRIADIETSLANQDLDSYPIPRVDARKAAPNKDRILAWSFCGVVLFSLLACLGVVFWQASDGKIERIETSASSIKDRRIAAEWVLANGGKIIIDDGTELSSPEEIPSGSFTITEVNLFSLHAVSDDGLANLSKLEELRKLRLEGTRVSNAGVKYLSGLKGLELLNLYGLKIDDEGLQQLSALSNMKELCLGGGVPITDAGLLNFKDCQSLQRLFLDGTLITDSSLEFLHRFEELQELNVGGTLVTEKGLMRLGDFKGLVAVCLIGTATTDAVVEMLARNPGLTTLNIESTQVTDLSLKHLQKLKGLSAIYIRNNNLSVKAIEEFHAAVPSCQIYHDGGVIE